LSGAPDKSTDPEPSGITCDATETTWNPPIFLPPLPSENTTPNETLSPSVKNFKFALSTKTLAWFVNAPDVEETTLGKTPSRSATNGDATENNGEVDVDADPALDAAFHPDRALDTSVRLLET
jgi:hypothetical protein